MKKLFILISIIQLSCTVEKKPRIYGDLYKEKLVRTGPSIAILFYPKEKVFWLYSFKSNATLAFLKNSEETPINLSNSSFTIAIQYLSPKHRAIADSVGRVVALRSSKGFPKFPNFLYFNSSVYLDKIAKHYYRLHRAEPLTDYEKKVVKDSKAEGH